MRLADESDNKTVVTSRYVIDANSLITYASRDYNGDWQFWGNEDVNESDTCVVSVKTILAIDDSLYFLDLSPGQSAERIDIDSSWQTVK
ncbi:MAG: hypothetical protein ACK5KT_01090 [Dysgonomonas sp.]